MSRSDENLRNMLKALLESDDFITLGSLSKTLNISRRSVQNYLSKAKPWLQEHGLASVKIIKKQGCGICLDFDDAEKQKLSSLLESQYFTSQDGSISRRIELLRSLVFSCGDLTIQFLADKFYVSRSIIISDLAWAEEWLLQYHLKLFKTQGRGIGIVGDEVSHRAAIAGFFDLCEQRTPINNNTSSRAVRLTKQRMENLTEAYSEADIKTICDIIEEAENKFDFFMGSEYFTSLATHITISVSRLRHDYEIKKEFLPPNDEFPQLEMNTAMFIAKRLEDEFAIKLPKAERIYICIHLIGYNAFQEQNALEYSVPESIEALANQLIEAVDAETGSNFSSDKILFFGLVYHLRNSIYQQKENFDIRKTYHDIQLPESCQDLYTEVVKQTDSYRRISGITPDKTELMALTLHFSLSRERTAVKWRVLLVSNADIFVQYNQRNWLQNAFPSIQIVDMCSGYQFPLYPEGSYDFIITLIPLETKKPFVSIAHMSREQGISAIEEFLFEKM